MCIYKITNKVNNKVYIGQTIKTIEKRFSQHISKSKEEGNNLYLSRAIRKYGKENFEITQIDTASSKKELDEKEKYYINYYDSIKNGYNLCDGGGDCNTYRYKTDDEMKEIKNKISLSKTGGKNPNARSIKCMNINSKEELFFNSMKECQEYFKESSHSFVSRRCRGEINFAYKKSWKFAYIDEDYKDYTKVKNNRNSRKVEVEFLKNGEIKTYENLTLAEKDISLYRGCIAKNTTAKNTKTCIIKNYKITILD